MFKLLGIRAYLRRQRKAGLISSRIEKAAWSGLNRLIKEKRELGIPSVRLENGGKVEFAWYENQDQLLLTVGPYGNDIHFGIDEFVRYDMGDPNIINATSLDFIATSMDDVLLELKRRSSY